MASVRASKTRMKKILFLLLAYPVFAVAGDWRDFSIGSDTWFSIQTTGNGSVSIQENNVTVKIHSVFVSGTDKITNNRTLTELQVGIAYYKNKDDWLVSKLSKPQIVNAVINKNTKLSITPFKTSFVVSKNILNKEHWIVLQMTLVDINSKKTYVFAHEPD